jgi:hypothetical protein
MYSLENPMLEGIDENKYFTNAKAWQEDYSESQKQIQPRHWTYEGKAC